MVHQFYRFAWPRAIFFTLRFWEPRAYSRGFSGFSALRFLRDARLAFLRSSLLRALVFAMISLSSCCAFGAQVKIGYNPALARWAKIFRPQRGWVSGT